MSDLPERRKRPRHQTPVEILRRLRDGLDRLRAEAEGADLDDAAEAIATAMERVEAEIRGRLV